MADLADRAQSIEAEHLARGIAAARVVLPVGTAGECDDCGEAMPRLIDGRCPPCIDGRRTFVAPERLVAKPIDPVVAIAAMADAVDTRTHDDVGAFGRVKRVGLNARITVADMDRVRAIAEAEDSFPSTIAAELLVEALDARAAPPPGKPLLRAAVLAALRDDGRPFGQFITHLIDLGLAVHLEDLAGG